MTVSADLTPRQRGAMIYLRKPRAIPNMPDLLELEDLGLIVDRGPFHEITDDGRLARVELLSARLPFLVDDFPEYIDEELRATNATFGANLTALLEAHEMTTPELVSGIADELGIAPRQIRPSVSRWRNGHTTPAPDRLVVLAHQLGTAPAFFYGEPGAKATSVDVPWTVDQLRTVFASNLSRAIAARGMMQVDLAHAYGHITGRMHRGKRKVATETYVSDWTNMTRMPRRRAMIVLTELLDCSIADLYTTGWA